MGVKRLRRFHQARWNEPIIFERSIPGRRGIIPPVPEKEIQDAVGDWSTLVPDSVKREVPPALPELSQKDVLAHYLRLSQETLGSNICNDISEGTCTMKYNPRINEELAALPGLASTHPWQDEETVQGTLQMYPIFSTLAHSSSEF